MTPDDTPVFVFVHGHDDPPSTLEPVRRALDPEDRSRAVFPIGPNPSGDHTEWFPPGGDAEPHHVAAAIGVIDAAIRDAGGADPDGGPDGDPGHGPVILVGYSQGAAAALAAAFHPDAAGGIEALVLLAPFALTPDLTTYDFTRLPASGVHVVHGEDDDAVPAMMGRAVAKLLERNGVPVTFTVVPGAGHAIEALLPTIRSLALGP